MYRWNSKRLKQQKKLSTLPLMEGLGINNKGMKHNFVHNHFQLKLLQTFGFIEPLTISPTYSLSTIILTLYLLPAKLLTIWVLLVGVPRWKEKVGETKKHVVSHPRITFEFHLVLYANHSVLNRDKTCTLETWKTTKKTMVPSLIHLTFPQKDFLII